MVDAPDKTAANEDNCSDGKCGWEERMTGDSLQEVECISEMDGKR